MPVCPLRVEQFGMAEAMDVMPLPSAQVGPGAVEQGQGGGDVVLPPLLVGHLHRPPVLEPLELLPLPFGLGPRLCSAIRAAFSASPSGRPPPRPAPARRPATARRPRPPGRRAAPPAARARTPRPGSASAGPTWRPARPAPAARTLTGSPATNRPQVGGQGRGRRVAVGRVLRQALQADQLQVAGQAGRRACRAARARPRPPSGAGRCGSGVVERPGPGQALVEDHPEGVDVGLRGRRTWSRPGPARGPCRPGCPSPPGSPSGRRRRPAWPGRSR